MTADDIKGTNRIREYMPDRPVLCEDKVRTLGDPIVGIAAETREQARAAAAAVKVEYEPLPILMTPEESLAHGAYQIHSHSPNLLYSQPLIKGDADKALAESAIVVEHEFSTQMNHQAPLEPESCVAYLDGEGEDAQLVVIGRSIAIHIHADRIKESVGWENVRYKEPFVGGQFGIKVNITSEAVTAAAALHFKRPIKYEPSITESMQTTPKRPPYDVKLKLGADEKGKLTAINYDFTINQGAYSMGGHSSHLDRCLMMLQGAYHIPNIKALGRLVYTNNASAGAARGAGPPETMFAVESAMDMLADKFDMDPLEFRKMNSLQTGQAKATGPKAAEWPFPELCDALKSAYEKANKDAKAFNAQGGKIRHGVGLGVTSFGIGDFGDEATLHVEIDPDDGITIYAAVADPGEGNDAMLTQLAADKMDLPLEKVRLYTRDTDKTESAGGSWGSRMTFIAGNALVNAIDNLKKAMEETGTKSYAGLKKADKPTRYKGYFSVSGKTSFDKETGQGPNFRTECHNIQMAEVEVDTETGEAKVLKITSAVDAGPVINPKVFEGQLEGGMDQGVGYALREEYIHGKTVDYVTFKFPMIKDTFEMDYIIRETPRSAGYHKSTGIGEVTMTSTAPAVINAIYNACGARVYHLPATPDKIKKALK
jgi:aldehyde oxidoreductase